MRYSTVNVYIRHLIDPLQFTQTHVIQLGIRNHGHIILPLTLNAEQIWYSKAVLLSCWGIYSSNTLLQPCKQLGSSRGQMNSFFCTLKQSSQTLCNRGARSSNSFSNFGSVKLRISCLFVRCKILGRFTEHKPQHSLSISFRNREINRQFQL